MGATQAEIQAHSRHVQLQKTPVEEIERAYTLGQITYADKKSLLQEKAIQVNKDAFGDQGYLHAIYRKTLDEIQKGMENLKEAATMADTATSGGSDPLQPIHIRNTAYSIGLAIWGQIQILNSIPTAVGEVNGLVAERIALQNGASPATAKYVGIATDVGSNFVPIGAVSKATVQGGTAIAKATGQTSAQQAAKAAEKAAAQAKGARAVVEEAIDVSLKREGVEKTIFSKVEQAGTTPSAAPVADFAKKGENVITPSGKAINTATGEVIESGVKVGDEFVAAGTKVRVSRVHTAQEIAEKKLGVPKEQVSEMLQGWAPEAMARGDVEGAATTFVAEMEKGGANIEKQVKQMIADAMKDESGSISIPAWGQITEMYRNLLLASPVGRARDMVSNMASTGLQLAQRTVGAAIGDSTTITGSMYYAKGMTLALHEAFDSAASAFARSGAAGTTRFDRPLTREIPGLFGDLVNIPTSLTVGIDRGFKTINRRGALYAQELEAAKNAGRAFDIQNVNLPTKEMWDKAVQVSEYVTFQNDLGKMGKMLQSGVAATGIGELYFPFLKTPINLAKYSWNNTPGLQLASGRLWNEIKAGGEAADLAMGRLTISNMFGFYISELVKSDMITGSGPADPDLRAAWLATHEPYSWRVGDRWIPYAPVGPIAQSVGMVADYTQIMAGLSKVQLEQGAQAIMMSVERNLGENSWFRNLTDLTSAVKELGKSDTQVKGAVDVATKPFLTMATGGQAGAVVRHAMDPETREARGMMDLYMSEQPGWSVTVPLGRDGYGDKIVPPMAIGGRWASPLNPVKVSEKPKDRMRVEGDRLKVKLPYFGDSIGGSTHEFDLKEPQAGDKIPVGITKVQKDEWQQIYGNYLEHPKFGMNALMDSPEYQNGSDAYKRVQFQGRTLEAKANAEEALKLKYPSLGIKEIQNEASQYLPQLNQQDQYKAQWAYKKAIDWWEQLTPAEVDNLLRFSTEME